MNWLSRHRLHFLHPLLPAVKVAPCLPLSTGIKGKVIYTIYDSSLSKPPCSASSSFCLFFLGAVDLIPQETLETMWRWKNLIQPKSQVMAWRRAFLHSLCLPSTLFCEHPLHCLGVVMVASSTWSNTTHLCTHKQIVENVIFKRHYLQYSQWYKVFRQKSNKICRILTGKIIKVYWKTKKSERDTGTWTREWLCPHRGRYNNVKMSLFLKLC